MPIIPTIPVSRIPRDADGAKSDQVAVNSWHPQKMVITESAWVKLPAGANLSSRIGIAIQSYKSNLADIVIAPNDTDYSNDPTQPNCGLFISPGGGAEPNLGSTLEVYARVVPGGADCSIIVAELS